MMWETRFAKKSLKKHSVKSEFHSIALGLYLIGAFVDKKLHYSYWLYIHVLKVDIGLHKWMD